jgi:hypothetical protein
MLGLPSSTEVNRRVTKEKLYANATLTPQIRDMIRNQIDLVIWQNKLTDSTMAISTSEIIKEIQVLEVQLRKRELDKRILSTILKAIPYKILFVLTYHDEAQVWIEASETFYNTDWQPIDELKLKFEGLNLDTLYENLARQIADGRLGTCGNLEEAVYRDNRRRKLEKDIAAMENKVAREKQFNKQVELNDEVKRMRKELKTLEEQTNAG